jgi:hypothetical protein
MPTKKTPAKPAEQRDTADRRAGPSQGPYVDNEKLPRARNEDGTWRKKRSDAKPK